MAGTTMASGKRWLRTRRRGTRVDSVIVCGAGVGPGIGLTIDAQRVLSSVGRILTLGISDVTRAHLAAHRLRLTDLDVLVDEAESYAAGYVAVVDVVMQRAHLDPPAVLVMPGNPFFRNGITRYLAEQAAAGDVAFSVIAAPSPVDALVNDLGLDVAGRGLQVFDARSLVGRRIVPNPAVPMFLFGLDVLVDPRAVPGADPVAAFGRVAAHLSTAYPPDALVTLVTQATGTGSLSHHSCALADVAALWPAVGPEAVLYLGPVVAIPA